MKHIVLTGGGTAGHVTNIALIPKLKGKQVIKSYIGSYDGMERKADRISAYSYYGISSGKLRRYFPIEKLFRSIPRRKATEAKKLLKKAETSVVFSKAASFQYRLSLPPKHVKSRRSSMNRI